MQQFRLREGSMTVVSKVDQKGYNTNNSSVCVVLTQYIPFLFGSTRFASNGVLPNPHGNRERERGNKGIQD